VLWSTETQNGFVHVEYHGDISVDAWARASDVTALPPGETMDVPPTVLHVSHRRLKVDGSPKLVKTDKELVIRASPSATATVLGRVEKGTEMYLTDIVAGWASVLPKAMNLLPEGEAQFWVLAADLGAG
jgi:hypothetical protein